MRKIKIAYDAGHGYNTPGKRSPIGEREWMFNNIVVLAFEAEMKKYNNVELLRVDDPTGKTDVPLATRTNNANAWGATIYISFHHNAFTGKWGDHTGVETFYFKGSAEGYKLARAVHNKVRVAYGLRDRGLKVNNLHITRETKMPAILLEGGFMDSRIDIVKLRNNNVLKNAGIATAHGVLEYFGIPQIKEDKPVANKPVNNTPSLWAKEAWEWATKEGLLDGTRPKDPIKREELALVLQRLLKK